MILTTRSVQWFPNMTDDRRARQQALDPGASFAVQAPAGSGKTTLLTQRLLRLLTTVDEPEQVVAITFTRKAAEEMRTRIVEALELASGPAPDDDFARQTWELAVSAARRDAEQHWRLTEQPARLRIKTIDALCQSLVRQMPVTAGLAGRPEIVEDARALHREAARGALAEIASGGSHGRAIARVLQHLDNDWSKLETLLADMLARRDQWLPLMRASSDQEFLEQSYRRTVGGELAALDAAISPPLADELTALGAFAGAHLDASPLRDLAQFPAPEFAALEQWQALAGLLLTNAGEWRKRVDKRDGFPAAGAAAKAMKVRHQDAIAVLATVPALNTRLARVRDLPALPFEVGDWAAISALLTLLKAATAHLLVLCEQGGRSDFTAFSLAALTALGESEQPTDLALALDYQIRHLLIDEFQDTSITQYDLVCGLIAGWTEGDGRSLFLVGDPMQSIYRFRQADVSLFRRVLDKGYIGSVRLQPLTLERNFRAQGALVDWINTAIPQALAAIDAGSEYFVPQTAVKPALPQPCTLHAFAQFDAGAEAARVVSIVAALRAADATTSIAILVRSRTHLGHITAELIAAGVRVAAREIKPFSELGVIADLQVLARALLHDADRVAWLALLRAPWCGLSLATLTDLVVGAATVPQAIDDSAWLAALEDDERARVERVRGVIAASRAAARVDPFSAVLEQTWIALGGPALAEHAQDLLDARAFFEIILSLEREGAGLTAERIAARLLDRFSTARGESDDAVQVMTVHRAKGLEFDHVIIPGLGRRPRGDSRRLLLLRQDKDFDSAGAETLLLAPIPVTGESPLYEYLRARDATEANEETARVLYVALTRARRQVHLLAHGRQDRDGEWQAEKGALLSLLWPALGPEFKIAVGDAATTTTASTTAALGLRRARPHSLPQAHAIAPGMADTLDVPPEFEWAGPIAKHVGTVIHRLLQELGQRGPDQSDREWQAQAVAFGRQQLRALGIDAAELDQACATVAAALATTVSSTRGRWLFAPEHEQARSELCLAGLSAAASGRIIIDRTFVAADGRRWIVDFKTGTHSGGDRDAYLDSEVLRYRPQLQRYARIMTDFETRPIMLGLYFPLLDAWREWSYADG